MEAFKHRFSMRGINAPQRNTLERPNSRASSTVSQGTLETAMASRLHGESVKSMKLFSRNSLKVRDKDAKEADTRLSDGSGGDHTKIDPSVVFSGKSALAFQSRNFMFKEDKKREERLAKVSKGMITRPKRKVAFSDLKSYRVIQKKGNFTQGVLDNQDGPVMHIPEGMLLEDVSNKIDESLLRKEDSARDFWFKSKNDAKSSRGITHRPEKFMKFENVFVRQVTEELEVGSQLSDDDFDGGALDFPGDPVKSSFGESLDGMSDIGSEDMNQVHMEDFAAKIREFILEFDNEWHNVNMVESDEYAGSPVARESQDVYFLDLIREMLPEKFSYDKDRLKSVLFQNTFKNFVSLTAINRIFDAENLDPLKVMRKLACHPVFGHKGRSFSDIKDCLDYFFTVFERGNKRIQRVEINHTTGNFRSLLPLRGITRKALNSLQCKIFLPRMFEDPPVHEDFITGEAFVVARKPSMRRRSSVVVTPRRGQKLVSQTGLSEGQLHLLLPSYLEGLGQFLAHPLRAYAEQKLAFAENYYNALNTGLVSAVLNNDIELIDYFSGQKASRAVETASTTYHGYRKIFGKHDGTGNDSSRSGHKLRIVRKTSGDQIIRTSSLNSLDGLSTKSEKKGKGSVDQVIPIDSITGVINPLVRADIYYSRRQKSCHQKCTGHRGKLLITAIRLANTEAVEKLVRNGIKASTKTCGGNTSDLYYKRSKVVAAFLERKQRLAAKKKKKLRKELLEDDKTVIEDETPIGLEDLVADDSEKKGSGYDKTGDQTGMDDDMAVMLVAKYTTYTPLAAAIDCVVSRINGGFPRDQKRRYNILNFLLDRKPNVAGSDQLALRSCLPALELMAEKSVVEQRERRKRRLQKIPLTKRASFNGRQTLTRIVSSIKDMKDGSKRKGKLKETAINVLEDVSERALGGNLQVTRDSKQSMNTIFARVAWAFEALLQEKWDLVRYLIPVKRPKNYKRPLVSLSCDANIYSWIIDQVKPKSASLHDGFLGNQIQDKDMNNSFDKGSSIGTRDGSFLDTIIDASSVPTDTLHLPVLGAFEVQTLSGAVDAILRTAERPKDELCSSTQERCLNAIFFILVEYSVYLEDSQWKQLDNIIFRVLEDNRTLKCGEAVALVRLFSTSQVLHHFGVIQIEDVRKLRLSHHKGSDKRGFNESRNASYMSGLLSFAMGSLKQEVSFSQMAREKVLIGAAKNGIECLVRLIFPYVSSTAAWREAIEVSIRCRPSFGTLNVFRELVENSSEETFSFDLELQDILSVLIDQCFAAKKPKMELFNSIYLLLSAGVKVDLEKASFFLSKCLCSAKAFKITKYWLANVSPFLCFKIVLDDLLQETYQDEKINHSLLLGKCVMAASDVSKKNWFLHGFDLLVNGISRFIPDLDPDASDSFISEVWSTCCQSLDAVLHIQLDKRAVSLRWREQNFGGNSDHDMDSLANYSEDAGFALPIEAFDVSNGVVKLPPNQTSEML